MQPVGGWDRKGRIFARGAWRSATGNSTGSWPDAWPRLRAGCKVPAYLSAEDTPMDEQTRERAETRLAWAIFGDPGFLSPADRETLRRQEQQRAREAQGKEPGDVEKP